MTSVLTGSVVPVPYSREPGTTTGSRFPEPREPVGTGGTSESKITFSNLDNHPLPTVTRPLKLAEQARNAGWHVRVGYARVEVPAHHHLNGNLAKAAHVLETISVQMRHPADGRRGWAGWQREDGGAWSFDHARIGFRRYGWTRTTKTKLPTILEGIME